MNKSSTTIIRSISILAIAVIGIGIYAPVALAATPPAKAAAPTPPPVNNAGQALEIAPPVITLSADPGKVIKTQINLRDISSSNLLVKGQVNDFVAAGEDGTPKILLDDTSNNPYSIKGWVASFPDLLMIPKQIRTLPVTITVPADASPGGHYGVVRFTATPPELKDTGVSLSASLGSLILINVSGDIKESMNVQEFTVSHNGKAGTLFESAPVSFTERLKNTGNTHEQPTGQVVITDMFGKKVGAVNVNLPPRNVLPNSIRKFDQPLDSTVIGNKKLFGRYTADLKVDYGAKKQSTTASLTFWIIPYKLIGIIVAVLIIGFFILRFFIRRYNRSIINRASRRR
jgi:hypothetical protein